MKKYSDIGRELNVSDATISNWVKTGVIPVYPDGRGYDSETYARIIDEIRFGGDKLQQRANRLQNLDSGSVSSLAFSQKSRLIIAKLRELYSELPYTLSEFCFVLGVICLERQTLIKVKCGKSQIYLSTDNNKFTAFINSWKSEFNDSPAALYRRLLVFDYPDNEIDFLGAVYESLRSISDKSANGAYFTPAFVCENISVSDNLSVLDPCAGTGTMLLKILTKKHDPKNIFLRDIDDTALKIAVINFVLHFDSCKAMVNIAVSDVLIPFDKPQRRFDYIISNPPYGARFPQKRKTELRYNFPELNTAESFSIALLQAHKMLKSSGKLIFILPDSFLYVGGHYNIRKQIFTARRDVSIRNFGKAFKGVLSSVIRLETEPGSGNVSVYEKDEFVNYSHKQIKENSYRPLNVKSEAERDVLTKMLSCKSFTLKGKCTFGLGIVTGNNKKHLVAASTQLDTSFEPIFTGRELLPCRFVEPRFYISLDPSQLQQVAPLQQYRSPKICYRFISDSVVTVFDQSGNLILNSLNQFVINDNKISPKALSAFLNSEPVTFIYRKLFKSHKLLKHHIESIPIPLEFFENIEKLESIYTIAENGKDVSNELNYLCCDLYGVDYNIVKNILNNS